MAPIENIPIESLIRRIITNTYSNQDLLDFLNLIEKIAVGYLRFLQRDRQHNVLLSGDGHTSLDQLAIDCIAHLFRRDETNNFVEFRNYFDPLLKNIGENPNIQLFVQLKRLIVSAVKQELARIFRQRDPEGAKVLRNVRNAIRNSENLLFAENMAHTLVFSEENIGDSRLFQKMAAGEVTIHHEDARRALRRDLPLMPLPELTEMYLSRFSPFSQYPTFVRRLLQIVKESPAYANYLLLEDIVYVGRSFKSKQVPLWDSMDEVKVEGPEASYYDRKIREFVETMSGRVQQIVDSKYGEKKRFSPEILQAFRKALNDFVEDFINKRKTPSYFNLLRRYVPDLSREDYRNRYRHAFEYLARAVQREISQEIVKIL